MATTPLGRRLFTLSGVVPLGAFLVLHALTNARALGGSAAFTNAVEAYDRVPGILFLEVFLVYLPLLFHGSYGVWLMLPRAVRDRGMQPSPFSPPWRLAVRMTGIVGALFVLLHLRELRFRLPGARPSGPQLLSTLAADLSSTFHGWPVVAALYLFASGCATFHFATGSWGVVATTRLVADDARAKTWVAWAAAVGGAALWLVFANVVVMHATGAQLFGSTPQSEEPPSAVEPPSCPPAGPALSARLVGPPLDPRTAPPPGAPPAGPPPSASK